VPNKKDLMDELDFLTDLISNRVRTISFGIVAFCWLFILQNITDNNAIMSNKRLLIPVILSILALFADFAQYWFGFYTTRTLLREIESDLIGEVFYDYRSLGFRLRNAMFYSKQILMVSATIWLLMNLGFILV
jgi:hypothetical protein